MSSVSPEVKCVSRCVFSPCLASPTVTSLLPPLGPSTGSTLVTVTGTNFISNSGITCKFGTAAAVSAAWRSASLLECVSPSGSSGSVAVEVSNNGQDYSSNAVQFVYYCAFIDIVLFLVSFADRLVKLG